MRKFSPAFIASGLRVTCAAFATFLVVDGVAAQFSACGDTLALFSPQGLSVAYESDPVPGNRLSWQEFDSDLTSCFRLGVPADLAARIQPELLGSYTAIYDRQIEMKFSHSGTIGTTAQDQLNLAISNNHPNPDIPPLAATINLSNRGGVYRVAVDGADAEASRANRGLPNHLRVTNITSMAVWSAPDNSSHRIYAAMDNVPVVRSDDGGENWVETAAGGIDPIGFPITHLAVSPADRDLIFAGTSSQGLWVSRDGGIHFELADQSIRPAGTFSGTTVLRYVRRSGGGHRLYVGMSGIGIFTSDDDGASWNRLNSLLVPRSLNDQGNDSCPTDPDAVSPRLLSLAQSPNDPDVLYAGLNIWGVYRSADGGVTWARANDDIVECVDGSRKGANVVRILVLDDGGSDRVVISTTFKGVYLSFNDGANWNPANGLPVDEDTNIPAAVRGIVEYPAASSHLIAGTPEDGLLESFDGGGNWAPLSFGSSVMHTGKIGSMIVNPVFDGEILVGTMGGGIYQPGDPIELSRALVAPGGPHEGADVSIGLSIRFAAGTVVEEELFHIFAQSFQGYAVWRATEFDVVTGEPTWELIGLYDRINPESCSPSGCDDFSPVLRPSCYVDKRANCFSFFPDQSAEFFDRDVFNGFTYQYAVTTFDYLFGGGVAPINFAGEMWFSPRSAMESTPESAVFAGHTPFGPGANYNVRSFQVNLETASSLDDVFVVPNPLRRQAGWDFGEESSIRFFNVTPSSTCEIFTLAGDLVARLGNIVDAGSEKGIIQWNTRNQSGEFVASGVYIYRITNASGEELIDRFTIIR